MGERPQVQYRECLKLHEELNGKSDGCPEFVESSSSPSDCSTCNCPKNFHRKERHMYSEVVYTKCLKIHDFMFKSTFDGCQEFVIGTGGGDACAVCGCHRSFHRKEIKYTLN